MSILKYSAVVVLLLLAGGCKIQIEVPTGGQVVSESGAYSCGENEVCQIDVVDSFFDETFSVTANTGYQFTGWQKVERGFCGRDTRPCRLVTAGFDQFELLLALLESPDEIFYLVPGIEAVAVTAFDPAVFYANRFKVREDGLDFRYRFREDGSYTKSSPPFVASGSYEFQADNQVIFYTELAETNFSGLTGYGVFTGFNAELGYYTVCYITDQAVGSASQAMDVCSNGAPANIDEPRLLRFTIE